MNVQIRAAVIVGTIAVAYVSGKYAADRAKPPFPHYAPMPTYRLPDTDSLPLLSGTHWPGYSPAPSNDDLYGKRGGREYSLPSGPLSPEVTAILSGTYGKRGGREFLLPWASPHQ